MKSIEKEVEENLHKIDYDKMLCMKKRLQTLQIYNIETSQDDANQTSIMKPRYHL